MSSVKREMPPRTDDGASKNRESGNTSKEETPLHQITSKPTLHPKCSENTLYHFQSFAENASIDGIKFLGEKGRTIPERVFWSVTLTTALILCTFLVVKTYQKWINTPVIVSFATQQISVHDIPFPSITICPETKATKDMFDYSKVFLKISNNQTVEENETIAFEIISLICDTGSELLLKTSTTTDNEVIDLLMKVGPDWNDSLISVQWRGSHQEEPYYKLFSRILTSEGICYTFNAFDRKELFTDSVSYHKSLFSTNGLLSEWQEQKEASIQCCLASL